ncbi:glycosyltransferase family 4 protein [Vallitaleaceae bacterium 9-2]
MNKKILIIVENLPVPFDTRVWQEATTLVKEGYEVSVICPTGKGFMDLYEQKEGVHIYRHHLPEEGNGFWGYLKEYYIALREETKLAKRIYKERGFDVIHGCNPPDNIFLIARKFKKYGVQYIFDHHDICPELYIAKFGKKGLLYWSQIFFERMTYKYSAMAFVTNESYKKIAIERNHMQPKDVFVLRSGPKTERLTLRPSKVEIKHGKKYMVGYVGVIGKQEGMDYLVDAVMYIVNTCQRKDIFFGICGGGPYLETIKNRVQDLGLSEYIEFTGRVSDDKLLDYLNTADLCVNPDEYNEMNDRSTMNKVLEYMALAKPIVQFDLTEGRYSAKDASLYAKPNDAIDLGDKILELLEDEGRRKAMGESGYQRVQNELSWNHTSKALIAGYEYYFEQKAR